MPKLPVITPQKLARALEKAGFELIRVRGSHYYYYFIAKTFAKAHCMQF